MTASAVEQIKYRRMWTEVPGYRNTSPGENLVPYFLSHAKWQEGETLIDVGCGPGRASVLLAEDFEVTQLDITATSRDPAVRKRGLPFIEACIWELPDDLMKFDWVYCTDVLEHVPPEYVDASLDALARITGKGAFMQIALFPEAFGRFIGDTLHLTVESAEWWEKKILDRWACEKFLVHEDRLIALTGAPK